MSNKRTPLVEGQKVRVKRNDYHGIKFGAVCTVVRVPTGEMFDDDFLVEGPVVPHWMSGRPPSVTIDTQFIELADILHAPQANKKAAK